jgi:hypothetical protein
LASNTALHADRKDKEKDKELLEPSTTRGTVWYEIIEHTHTTGLAAKSEDDTEDDISIAGSAKIGHAVVALYKSQAEAEMGLETKQLFAERLAKDRGLSDPRARLRSRNSQGLNIQYIYINESMAPLAMLALVHSFLAGWS